MLSLMPMDQILGDGVSPGHVAPNSRFRIVLEE